MTYTTAKKVLLAGALLLAATSASPAQVYQRQYFGYGPDAGSIYANTYYGYVPGYGYIPGYGATYGRGFYDYGPGYVGPYNDNRYFSGQPGRVRASKRSGQRHHPDI